MRLNYKFIILIALIVNVRLAQDWVQTPISGIGSIEFPSDPEIFD